VLRHQHAYPNVIRAGQQIIPRIRNSSVGTPQRRKVIDDVASSCHRFFLTDRQEDLDPLRVVRVVAGSYLTSSEVQIVFFPARKQEKKEVFCSEIIVGRLPATTRTTRIMFQAGRRPLALHSISPHEAGTDRHSVPNSGPTLCRCRTVGVFWAAQNLVKNAKQSGNLLVLLCPEWRFGDGGMLVPAGDLFLN
jgi:hypothetical protein